MGTVYKCRLCLNTTSKKVDIFKDDFPKMIQLLAGIKLIQWKVDQGFEKADSDHLPKVTMDMIYEYLLSNAEYFNAEIRNEKTVDPNDGILNTSCLECAKDVKFCMSVRKQILKSHKILLQELWSSHNTVLNPLIKQEAKFAENKDFKSFPTNKSNITRRKRARRREKTPESTSEEEVYDDNSECSNDSNDSDCDNYMESNDLPDVKPESTTASEAGETVVEEITVIHEVAPKVESKCDPDSGDSNGVKLEPTSETGLKSEGQSGFKESVLVPSPKRLLTKRNMIAASNRILSQSNSVKDRRYSNVIFIRKSRREKLEKKNQVKIIATKKEKKEDPNVIIKNGKKYAACEICKREVKKHYMKYHMTTHFPKHFSCDICGATTRNLRGLRYHKLYWHSSKLDYICDKCGKKYRSKHALDLHNKKEHGGVRDLECNICGKKFFQKMHLKRHVDGIHKKLRPHKCEYCGKDFTKRTHLVTHWRTHTNETPYGCDMCGERFKLKLSLKNHLKRVHNFEEEEKVFCNVCNRGFATEQGLRAHINSRVHEGQKCQYCSEIFTQEYLKTHLRDVHFHEVDYF